MESKQQSDRIDAVYALWQQRSIDWMKEYGARATGPMIQKAGEQHFREVIGPFIADIDAIDTLADCAVMPDQIYKRKGVSMNGKRLAQIVNEKEWLGGSVYLEGGEDFPDSSGWYYSLTHSLHSITDAVLDCSRGYAQRGDTADDVSGPFSNEEEAAASLAEFLGTPEGRAWFRKEAKQNRRRSYSPIRLAGTRQRKAKRHAANLAKRLAGGEVLNAAAMRQIRKHHPCG